MNRSLKIRVWDKKEKKWLFDYKQLGGFSLTGELMLMGTYHATLNRYAKEGRLGDLVVTQSTGARCSRGKDIYVGDVVSITSGDDVSLWLVCEEGDTVLSEAYQRWPKLRGAGFCLFNPLEVTPPNPNGIMLIAGNSLEQPRLHCS